MEVDPKKRHQSHGALGLSQTGWALLVLMGFPVIMSEAKCLQNDVDVITHNQHPVAKIRILSRSQAAAGGLHRSATTICTESLGLNVLKFGGKKNTCPLILPELQACGPLLWPKTHASSLLPETRIHMSRFHI